jgi:molybdopterin converting factor small subunit
MKIRVRYFSQLKEIAGTSDEVVDLNPAATVADLLAQVYRLHSGLQKWDRQLLIGAGLEFVGRDYLIQTEEEIALMPPVQGG